MQKLPIPQTNWTPDDGYVLMLLCCPNDPLWRGTVEGRIWELATGRIWDEATGRVTEVQKVGKEIWESMATCKLDDLVTAVSNLNVTLQANQESIGEQLALLNVTLGEIRDKMTEANVNTDELEEVLDAVNVILGGAAVLAAG